MTVLAVHPIYYYLIVNKWRTFKTTVTLLRSDQQRSQQEQSV